MSEGSSTIRCHCGRVSPTQCSWTDDNPGRRFVGCYRGKEIGHCNFFHWIDKPMCKRSRLIIPGLLKSMNRLEGKVDELSRRQVNLWLVVIACLLLTMHTNHRIRQSEADARRLEAKIREMESKNKKLWVFLVIVCAYAAYLSF